ncbi:unnamed protein product (macronuclear) [Paramecium tetraurelia]|uniref:Uncharacterized protein n=1 Tax=Paramecium tetraurelia TaxID=5888 RepID=A0BGD9_PARTE|nr:uncharacterized protein GSPATT00028641001 [Paramecium tetraurelia]CAK57606.1 unnamed protein product [Paramecium tetraurelia]|eukprot:XP_001425004.1 hypothetical protein (macronuclear) [Paramecium tetraurelia strain d4-2]
MTSIIRKFQNETLIKNHVLSFVGFMAGLKLCDYLLFDDKSFQELKEDMEDEFWAHNGEPTQIQPYIVDSVKGGKRKSWIYIMYEKDQLIKKKDEFD